MSEKGSVRIVEIVDAPRERVFAAWTEEEQVKQWWGPGQFQTTHASLDLRPGGRYELTLEPGGLHLVGEFREVKPPERIVYTWRWAAGVPDTRESLVTVEFRDLGEQTEIVLLHDNFAGPGPVDMYDKGWVSGLEKLQAFLATEPIDV